MDLMLNETQEMIRDSARRLLADSLDLDAVRELERTDDAFDAALWRGMAKLGWTTLAFPEELGGGGCGLIDLCVLAEELGRAAAPMPLVETAGLSARLLQAVEPGPGATDLLKRLATTDTVIVPAFTEAGGRNEQSSPSAQLQASDSGGTVSGAKMMVPFASAAQVLLVSVTTPDGVPAIVAVETESDGVSYSRHDVIGGKPLFRVDFDGVDVRAEQVLARGPIAEAAMAAGIDAATVLATAEVVGTCEGMLELAAEYVTNRQQFGQPIGRFQAVAHPIADIRINTAACRFLAAETAWTIDQGRDASLEVAGTKVFANEVVVEMVHAAHAVHGAIGYSTEYHLQLFTRRARAFCLNYGDTDSQTERAAVAMGL